MAAIHDDVFDIGLTAAAASGSRLDILAADPGLVYATVTTNTLGNSTAAMTGPANSTAAVSGREIYFPAIGAGTVTNTATAGFWAITNGASKVIASGALTTAQAVTSGNTFSLDEVAVSILDAT
jgi:hypothetical protein